MKKFMFELNDPVRLNQSGEKGIVVGRAEYTNCGNNYLVRYAAGDGRQCEAWWAEDALTSAAA